MKEEEARGGIGKWGSRKPPKRREDHQEPVESGEETEAEKEEANKEGERDR